MENPNLGFVSLMGFVMGTNCWAVMLYTDTMAVKSLRERYRERERENRCGFLFSGEGEENKRK